MATSPPLIPRARRPALIPYHEDLSLALAAAAKYSSPVSSPVDEDREVHRGGKGDLRADLGDWVCFIQLLFSFWILQIYKLCSGKHC